MRRLKAIAIAIAIMATIGACSSKTPTGGSTPTPSGSQTAVTSPTATASSPSASVNQVQATDQMTFAPVSITVKVGQTVTWTNNSSVPHTVAFDNGPSFDKPLDPGSQVTRTFTTAGTFNYHCTIHGPSMHGTIVVTD